MLLSVKAKILTTVQVFLKFDDGSEKTVVLEEGNVEKITYTDKGKLKTVEGVIEKMIVPLNGGEITVMMDCSAEYESNDVSFTTSAIRDIYVTPTDAKGTTIAVSDDAANHYVSSEVNYEGATPNVELEFNINSKAMDPAVLDELLDQEVVEGEYGAIRMRMVIDKGALAYKDATKAAVAIANGKGVEVEPGEPVDLIDGKVLVTPVVAKTYYRMNEDDEWMDASTLPAPSEYVVTLGDQLSAALSIERERLNREYGYLFKFETMPSGSAVTARVDFYKDNSTIGTQYFTMTYSNAIKPEEIIVNLEEFTMKTGETKQLTVKVLPENAPVPTVSYVSANPEIVAVSTVGLVTAVSAGTTTITVTSVDNPAIVKKFYITVTGEPVNPPTFTAEATDVEVELGKSANITVSCSDSIVADELLLENFSVLGVASAEVVDPTTIKVIGVMLGETVITIKAKEEGYVDAECTATIRVVEPPVLAVLDDMIVDNGTVEIHMVEKPTTAPVAEDFTATMNVNETGAQALALENFSYDGDETVKFTFAPVEATGMEQIVTVEVSMGEQVLSGTYNVAQAYVPVTDYAELKDAIATGGIVKLTTPVVLEDTLTVPVGVEAVLDLNGQTVSYGDKTKDMIFVSPGASLTINDETGNGVIEYSIPDPSASNYSTFCALECRGKVVVNGGTIKTGDFCYWGIGVTGTDCDVTLNGGKLDSTWNVGAEGGAGIAANGTKTWEGYKLTINDGFELHTVDTGLYLPSAGNVTINGGSITTESASTIELRAGDLVINGGTITHNGTRKTDVTANSGATGSYCAALTVVKPAGVSATGYNGHININIAGGSLVAPNGDALCVVHEAPKNYAEPQNVKVDVVSACINGGLNIQKGFGSIEGDEYVVDGVVQQPVVE